MGERRSLLDIVVRTSGQAGVGGLQRSIDKLEKSSNKMSKGIGSIKGTSLFSAFSLGIPLVQDAINAVQDFGKSGAAMAASIDSAHAIFGSHFKDISSWAEQMGGQFGLTSREMIAMSASTQLALTQNGVLGGQATKMTKQFGELAAAMSYAKGGIYSVADTTDMLQGAFRGEYDAMQRILPSISLISIAQETARMAKLKHTKVITGQMRMQAILNISQRDGAVLLRNYAKAQNSPLVKMNKATAAMKEQWQNLQMKLLPAFVDLWQNLSTKVTPAIADFITWLDSPKGQAAFGDMIRASKDFLTDIDQTTRALGTMAGQVSAITGPIVSSFEAMGKAASFMWQINPHRLALEFATSSSNPFAPSSNPLGLSSNTGKPKSVAYRRAHSKSGASSYKSAMNLLPSKSALNRPIVSALLQPTGGTDKGTLHTLPTGGTGGGAMADPDMTRLVSRITRNLGVVQNAFDAHMSKLDDLKQKYSDLSKTISDAFYGSAITGRGGSYSDMRASQTEGITRGRSMISALKRLKAAGLSNRLLGQIASEGPNALEQALSILDSGKSGISTLNQNDSILATIGKQAGKYVATVTYSAGIKAQTKATHTLNNTIKALNKALDMYTKKLNSGAGISDAQATRALKKLLARSGAAGIKGVHV
jgi:hypothetical protein